MLCGIDQVKRNPQGATDDIGRSPGQHRNRGTGTSQPVRDLVESAISTEYDDQVEAFPGGLCSQPGRVVRLLGFHGLHFVASLQGVDDEVLQLTRDCRRVGIDHHQDPFALARVGGALVDPCV